MALAWYVTYRTGPAALNPTRPNIGGPVACHARHGLALVADGSEKAQFANRWRHRSRATPTQYLDDPLINYASQYNSRPLSAYISLAPTPAGYHAVLNRGQGRAIRRAPEKGAASGSGCTTPTASGPLPEDGACGSDYTTPIA